MNPTSASASTALQIQQIMSRRIVTVEMDDRLEEVQKILESTGFHHVLVVEEKKLWGVVSDRDLLRALSPFIGSVVESHRDVATLNKRVHQIMSRKPIFLHPEASVRDAIALFLANRISCIPVVDEEERPIGIVSWRDILKTML
jgi:acetoin utilization protein AcuB